MAALPREDPDLETPPAEDPDKNVAETAAEAPAEKTPAEAPAEETPTEAGAIAARIRDAIGGVQAAIDKIPPEERMYETELAMRLGALERAQRVLARNTLGDAITEIRAMAQGSDGQVTVDLLTVLGS